MQIFEFSPTLAIPALSVVGVTLLFTLLSMALQMKQTKKIFEAKAKENGLVFSLLSGIQKIKITGAEKRAFSKWSGYYKDVLQYRYNPPKILALNGAISAFISVLGTILLYFIAVSQNVSMAEYMTFNVAYGMVLGAFVTLAGMSLEIENIEAFRNKINENLIYENGRIKIGDAPGLGIDLNEEECLKHPYVEHNLRHYTGALTDIRPAKTEFYF